MLQFVHRVPSRTQRFIALVLAGAPAAVLVLMLAGLYAADQLLLGTDATHAHADALNTAVQLERFVKTQAAALGSFRGLVGQRDDASWRREFGFLARVSPESVHGFHQVLIADGRGAVAVYVALDSTLPPTVTDSGMSVMTRPEVMRSVKEASQGHRTVLTPIIEVASGKLGLGIVAPVVRGDTVVGMVLGTITREAILSELDAHRQAQIAANRRLMVIVSQSASFEDTIAIIGNPRSAGGLIHGTAVASMFAGGQWTVEVAHARTGWPARLGLWAIGLTALAALAVSSFRERDQSRRIAERSQELEHLSTELLHANRAKSEFLANVSHELRTPLNAIVGFVDLLRDGVYGELAPRQISPVDRIAASANHLRYLVDQVLDLAKITAGRLEVHRDVVDLRAFVLAVASEMESLVTERGLALSLAVGATLPRLRTDPTHLRQILVNLMGNAIKYTHAGTITVRARLVGGAPDDRWPRATPDAVSVHPLTPPGNGIWVAVQVIDTGIGIAGADQDRIFDEFEQVGAGPRGDSMQRGTGLGLSISRRLAGLLGGNIEVESQVGKGSTFTLWLPVDPADVGDGKARPLSRDSASASVGKAP